VTAILKFTSGSVIADSALGDRQIRVVANSGKSDRVKDVLVAKGCQLENYKANPIVLADHDPTKPIGNFAPEIKGDSVEGVITFAPAGISPKADEYCGLYKSDVLKTVSVGFTPLEFEPIKGGGLLFQKWELMELSCVAVPCDPGAVVTARSFDIPAIDGEGVEGFFERNHDKLKALIEESVERSAGGVLMLPKSIKPRLKGLYDVAQLAYLLSQLGSLQSAADWEAEIEMDASKVPAMLGNALKVLADAFLAMTAEETAELLAGCNLDVQPDEKLIRATFAKAGRVLSGENADHLQGAADCLDKAYDLSNELQGLQDHINEAAEHVKCVMQKGKKPSLSDQTAAPEDSDMELGFDVARQKTAQAAQFQIGLIADFMRLDDSVA
jgi:HK97 family phage prohead protease